MTTMLRRRRLPAAAEIRNHPPLLVAPAAVRLVDLEQPLVDLELPLSRFQEPYRSLLVVARLDGDPLGIAAVPVGPAGRVSRRELASSLVEQLEEELGEALALRGAGLSELLPPEGIPARFNGSAEPVATDPAASVVVTTCSNPVQLERCLASILASDYGDFEVVVVENRPQSPATRQMLAQRFADESRLHYVEEREPGKSRACNAGLARAEGDVIAFTDDDVVVDRRWIRRLARGFDGRQDVACVTGLILPLELETRSQLLMEQFASFGKGFRRKTYRLSEARDTHPFLAYAPGVVGSGANNAVRADVARELGGFDNSLGPGVAAAGADLDLYVRLLRAGYAVTYEPAAILWHEHPNGMATLRRKVFRYGVGLGTMITRQLVTGPDRRGLVRAVPAGVRHAFDPDSRKNAGKAADFPRRLDWLERAGMALGPVVYAATAAKTARPLARRNDGS